MSSVDADIEWGEQVEKAWARYLLSKDSTFQIEYSVGKVPGWDLKVTRGDGRMRLYEVKWDASAQTYWKGYKGILPPTGNAYMEIYNPRSDKPAGLMASRAHYYVYAMLQANQYHERLEDLGNWKSQVYLFDADRLKKYVTSHNFKERDASRDVTDGRVNSRGKLIPLARLNKDAEECGLLWKVDFTEYIRFLFL